MKSPTHITLYRREHTMFNHLTLYLLFPSIKIREDLDYDSVERGITAFSLNLDTYFKWEYDRDHWTVSGRVLGLGLTLTRQVGY